MIAWLLSRRAQLCIPMPVGSFAKDVLFDDSYIDKVFMVADTLRHW